MGNTAPEPRGGLGIGRCANWKPPPDVLGARSATDRDGGDGAHEITLEANRKSETTHFMLQPADGNLVAQAGDRLTIRFRLNWGVTRLVGPKISMRLATDEPT